MMTQNVVIKQRGKDVKGHLVRNILQRFSMGSLASLYQKQGRDKDSEDLFLKALELLKKPGKTTLILFR